MTDEKKNNTAEETSAEIKEEKKAEAPEKNQKEEPEKKPKKEEKKTKKEPDAPKEEEPVKPTPEQELAGANDRYLRLMAEYDNYRKRSQKEKDSLYGEIKVNAVREFLPVFDNLERALAAETADEAYRKGVEMIMAQFNKTLEKLGVTEIKCLGEKFNPQFHNAVMHVEDEEKGENEIVEVFQKGFMLGDKVVRFAMVKVAN